MAQLTVRRRIISQLLDFVNISAWENVPPPKASGLYQIPRPAAANFGNIYIST